MGEGLCSSECNSSKGGGVHLASSHTRCGATTSQRRFVSGTHELNCFVIKLPRLKLISASVFGFGTTRAPTRVGEIVVSQYITYASLLPPAAARDGEGDVAEYSNLDRDLLVKVLTVSG